VWTRKTVTQSCPYIAGLSITFSWEEGEVTKKDGTKIDAGDRSLTVTWNGAPADSLRIGAGQGSITCGGIAIQQGDYFADKTPLPGGVKYLSKATKTWGTSPGLGTAADEPSSLEWPKTRAGKVGWNFVEPVNWIDASGVRRDAVWICTKP
jgi:hypothetical protein